MFDVDVANRRSAAISRGVGATTQVHAARAGNVESWDVGGRCYIDFASGIAAVGTGTARPKVKGRIDRRGVAAGTSVFDVIEEEKFDERAELLGNRLGRLSRFRSSINATFTALDKTD